MQSSRSGKGILLSFAFLSFLAPQAGAQSCTVIPPNGPFAGGNSLLVTNASPHIGNGSDVTNVRVGGVTATITTQGENWVKFTVPSTGSAGLKDFAVQSTSIGVTTFADAYTVNLAGRIGEFVEDWTQWQEVAGLPIERRGMAAGVLNGALYAVGGTDNDYNAQTNAYRYDGTNWTEVAGLPASRVNLAAGVLNGALYAVGGYRSGVCTNVYRYDGTNWTEVAGLPAGRIAQAAGALNGMLYSIGGRDADGGICTNVYRYDGTNWTEVAGLPLGRQVPAVGVLNGALYVVGGATLYDAYTNVYQYDGSGWMEVSGLPTARGAQAAGVLNGMLYSIGGNADAFSVSSTNVYRYNGTNWTEVAGLPTSRVNLAAGVLNGALYVIGGDSSGYIVRSNVYRYPRIVDAISPSGGSCTGGYPIIISGADLGNGSDITNVTVCGVSANIDSQSATQIVVTAASANAGPGDVVVHSTSYGTTTRSNGFLYNPAIRVVIGPHGAVSPSGVVNVVYGGSTGFVVGADTYYHIASLLTNGVDVGAAANQRSYTSAWVNVTATGMLAATFAENLTTNTTTPEWWLAQYGWTNNFETAATNDVDGDRMLTWAEYLAGTDPTNQSSLLRFVDGALTEQSTEIVVRWQSVDGKFYRIERGTNLTDAPVFRNDVLTNIPGTAPMNTETDVTAVGQGPWFYRIKLE